MLCPPETAYSVASALTSSMDHRGTFTDGSYSCCGEGPPGTPCARNPGFVTMSGRCAKWNDCGNKYCWLQRYSDGDDTTTKL
ncbi:unnamed protein product [Ranitomeya imitator]|uniref:Uncharacterized protein n=1 Tax=Ranitomeya imitator TaxID=111125 RepID=A0ABN9LYD6_9NEOB|nr:unnamed protein product [Ranitomeya imitator]